MTPPSVAETIDAVWRIESARLIAGLARIVGDIGVAEDLAQDALVAALEQWPDSGIPDNPGAWLMGTAKHRAIDYLRRGTMQAPKTWRRTRWSRRSSSGRTPVSPTIRVPGSWGPPNTAPSTTCGAARCRRRR